MLLNGVKYSSKYLLKNIRSYNGPISSLGRSLTSTPKPVPVTMSAGQSLPVNHQKFEPGKIYNGFLCKQAEFIPDFNMTAYMFVHEAIGSQYMHIDRNDPNNVFSINFRTTPFDSTGLPHILEHNVLCGSERFPIRDPFFKMLNRSMATFMNAMTGPDYTLYPFSSMNETDFSNLQKIYLDAVFKPNLKYFDFLQEGWRLEHETVTDQNSPIQFKGVVYNEMKGAFSENSSVFMQKFFNKILPDHTYRYVSGGDPLDIPQLTHENLVAFHQKYYHPSNARFISYGNFDVNRSLNYINGEYLSRFDRIDSSFSRIPSAERWSQPKSESIVSRFDNMGAPIERQNQIAIGYIMNDVTDNYETLVVYIITELLIKGPNSFMYKNLIEPNVSGGYNQMTGFDTQIRDTMFTVGLQDLAVNDFDWVKRTFDETIDEVLDKGFDAGHLDSVLHYIELGLKHQSPKFGLGLLLNLTPLWNHEGDVINSLKVNELLARFRNQIRENPKYLQEKVKFYFKENPHRLTLTMSPNVDYEKEFSQAEHELLLRKVSELSDDDKTRVYNNGLKLAESQKSVENLKVLPCLSLTDVKDPPPIYEMKTSEIDGVRTHICPTDTNRVTYIHGLFNVSHLTREEILLIPLLTNVINQMGTKNHDYRTFDKLVNTKTSGISFGLNFAENINDFSKFELGLSFSSYCLSQNTSDMFNLISELLNNFQLTDVSRFDMLLESYLSDLSVGIANNGHGYAMQSSAGLVTEAGQLKTNLIGVEHIDYIKRLMKENKIDEILGMIDNLARKIINRNSLKCALNLTDIDEETTLLSYKNFLSTIPLIKRDDNKSARTSKLLERSCLHNVMTIPVNYCAKSIATVSYTHPDYSTLRVLAKMLSAKYLLPVVREQNGAYGTGAKISADGIFSFFSYRDPNSRKTLDAFDSSYDWLTNNWEKLDDQALFEAKLGVLQALDAPVTPGSKGLELLHHGISQDILKLQRHRILSVDKKSLQDVAAKYLNNKNLIVGKCVLGPENDSLKKDEEKWTVKSS